MVRINKVYLNRTLPKHVHVLPRKFGNVIFGYEMWRGRRGSRGRRGDVARGQITVGGARREADVLGVAENGPLLPALPRILAQLGHDAAPAFEAPP